MTMLGFPGMVIFVTIVYLSFKTLLVGLRELKDIPGTDAATVWGMALLASMAGVVFQINTLSFAYHSVLWIFLGLVGAWYSAIKHHQPDFTVKFGWKDAGGIVVDDPDRVRIYGDKAVMHHELARAGVELPQTLLWRPDQPSRELFAAERQLLGERIVCKPARGSGAGGVVLDMNGSRAALDAAREYDPHDTYLLQEFVTSLDMDGRPAWFRVYNCFGRIFACFWHPQTHATALVSPAEMDAYHLHELERISRTIALISGYTWFSTEIAIAEREGRRVFLPIDYLNNKCFMLTHGEAGPCGMPDTVAEAVAREMVVQAQWRSKRRALLRYDEAWCYAA